MHCAMSEALSTSAPVQALSIFRHASPNLTGGQMVLMEMLNECYSKGIPITRDHVIRAYFKAMPENAARIRRIYKCKDNPENPNGPRIFWYEERRSDDPEVLDDYWEGHRVNTCAYAWFRNNLGSCIVKGRLVAIPVIEIEG